MRGNDRRRTSHLRLPPTSSCTALSVNLLRYWFPKPSDSIAVLFTGPYTTPHLPPPSPAVIRIERWPDDALTSQQCGCVSPSLVVLLGHVSKGGSCWVMIGPLPQSTSSLSLLVDGPASCRWRNKYTTRSFANFHVDLVLLAFSSASKCGGRPCKSEAEVSGQAFGSIDSVTDFLLFRARIDCCYVRLQPCDISRSIDYIRTLCVAPNRTRAVHLCCWSVFKQCACFCVSTSVFMLHHCHRKSSTHACWACHWVVPPCSCCSNRQK